MELLTCCRTDEELEQLRLDVEAGDHRAKYRIQSNLVAEKNGFRCTTCGRLYPMVEVRHNGRNCDVKALSRPLGRRLKYKKASAVFRGDHYYATNKKTLLRFRIDDAGNGILADETPIMGQTEYVSVSPDGRYIATQTFGGTVAVIDSATKETIRKRRSMDTNGTLRFIGRDRLVYYQHDEGLFCWNFREDQQTLLWQAPAQWREPNQRPTVTCHNVLEPQEGRLVFQLTAGIWNFALILDGLTPRPPLRLPDTRMLSHLCSFPGGYTLPLKDRILVYNEEFLLIDEFGYPKLITRLDGGGLFPIDTFDSHVPHHVHLSPNGRWALLDFHTELMLMDLETDEVRFFLWNHGTTSNGGGFLDDHRLWYTWADSTYIMDI